MTAFPRVRLKNLALIVAGQSPSSDDVTELSNGMPFIQGNAEFGALYPTPITQCDVPPKKAHAGDILISVRAPVGEVNLADQILGIGRGLASIRANDQNLKSYLYWALVNAREELESVATGSTFTAISASDLSDLRIYIPKNPRRVAKFLDRETAEIDAFIADQQKLKSLATERFNSYRSQIFQNLRRNAPAVKLKYLISQPLKYGANEPADQNVEGDIRYLRITDFNPDGSLDNSVKRTLPLDKAMNYLTEPRDILIARSGATVGKTFIIPEDLEISCFAGYLILIRCKATVDSLFVFHSLNEPMFKDWLAQHSTVATIANVSAQQYGEYTIPIPSAMQQNEVAKTLQENYLHARLLNKEIEKSIKIAQERRSALISAAVTGQIDVTDRYAAEKVYEEAGLEG